MKNLGMEAGDFPVHWNPMVFVCSLVLLLVIHCSPLVLPVPVSQIFVAALMAIAFNLLLGTTGPSPLDRPPFSALFIRWVFCSQRPPSVLGALAWAC
jgi:hypothetical protein